VVPAEDEEIQMTRLRSSSFGAAGPLRSSSFGAAGPLRSSSFGAAGRASRQALAMVIVLLIGGSSTIHACPVCFGAEETSMIEGTRLLFFVLLGITLAVQGAFVGFFLYLRNRAKRSAEIELETEWSELQRATR
jgi:hypothetical protein